MKRWNALLSKLLMILLLCCLLGLVACDDDDPTEPENTPTPTVVPTATPTPIGAWGYISGHARVLVSGLPENPLYAEKESIFCLCNPVGGAWINVRHREGNTYQLKGSLEPHVKGDCADEWPYPNFLPAGNGEWIIDWDTSGRITFTSPLGGVEYAQINGGVAAWREIRHGYCDLTSTDPPYASPATIQVLELTGVVGTASGCTL